MSDVAAAGIVAAFLTAGAGLYGVVWAARHRARKADVDQARVAFYAALQAWDQSQSPRLLDEVPLTVREEFIREAGRELSRVRSILTEAGTEKFRVLIGFLELPLLDEGHEADLERAKAQWLAVRHQVERLLSRGR